MEAMRILMDEHQSLAAIIHAIRHMIGEIGAGRLKPDFGLLQAMVRYLDAYPEKRHHPKEDAYLFAPLRALTHEADAALARLEAEHAQAEARIAALQAALTQYQTREQEGSSEGLADFSQAFDEYAAFYREHMRLEERAILPLLRQHFSADDWARADAGFLTLQDPMGGTREAAAGDDFTRIFAKLVAAAPAPIGHGAGPYRED